MSMFESSFIVLDGVGLASEKRLWRLGFSDWDSFISGEVPGFSFSRKLFADRRLMYIKSLLAGSRLLEAASFLHSGFHWRLFDLLTSRKMLALDIETTGYYGDISVIGVNDGSESFFLVKGRNLDSFSVSRIFRGVDAILTFNGSSFDLPIISRKFGISFDSLIHIDLRHVAAAAGFYGGLKSVERQLGICRPVEILGCDPVLLWDEYVSGSSDSLDILLEYNGADAANLFLLADKLIPRLWRSSIRSGLL